MTFYDAIYGTARYGYSYYGTMFEELNSDAYILKSGNDKTLNSDAYILKETSKTLNSDAFIIKETSKTLTSDSYILKETIETLNSDAYILKETLKTLTSNAYIFKTNEKTLNSDAYILKETLKTLTSDAYIFKTNEKTLNSDAYILKSGNSKTLNSDAWISIEIQNTLTSDAYIIYGNLADVELESWNELMDTDEFKKAVVYRNYDLDEDNITGDIDRSLYTDYNINVEVQLTEEEDKIVKSGTLQVGDAEIFMSARVTKDSNGDAIAASFRPKLKDEIIWHGWTFRIESIEFERMGKFEIFAECRCKRVKNVNPGSAWNERYEASDDPNLGRGYD